MLCFPAAIPPPRQTRTWRMGSPKTKVQRVPQTLTILKAACRARSPFPGALLTPLSETVHCQQLPKERKLWLVMNSDLRGRKGARGETVHDLKSGNPRFQEQACMNNPKGRVSPGEGWVKLRTLPVRPAGGRPGSSGCGKSPG